MSMLIPTAPDFSEFVDFLETKNEDSNDVEKVEAEPAIGSKFKPTYLLFEQMFRSVENNKNPKLLDNLIKLRQTPNDHGMYQLFIMQKIFLCHVIAHDRHAASLVLEEIITHIERNYKITTVELRELGDVLQVEEQGFQALMFCQMNSVLVLRRRPTPNDKIMALQTCVFRLQKVCKILLLQESNQPVVVRYVIPLIQELVNLIRGMSGADAQSKAKSLAWSSIFLSQTFTLLKMWEDSAKVNANALEVMQSTFGARAAQFWVVGVSSHQLGAAYYYMKDYTMAVKKLEEAVQNRIKGEDYRSAEERKKQIQFSTKLLNLARSKC